jgi:hypothetical protein
LRQKQWEFMELKSFIPFDPSNLILPLTFLQTKKKNISENLNRKFILLLIIFILIHNWLSFSSHYNFAANPFLVCELAKMKLTFISSYQFIRSNHCVIIFISEMCPWKSQLKIVNRHEKHFHFHSFNSIDIILILCSFFIRESWDFLVRILCVAFKAQHY